MIILLERAAQVNDLGSQRALVEGKVHLAEDAEAAERKFADILEQVKNNTLPTSNGGGLGITRALGEWAPDELYDAGDAVETFYMKNF